MKFGLAACYTSLLLSFCPGGAWGKSSQNHFFKDTIRPILQGSCYECHSHTGEEARGGLVVDSRKALLKGGDSGPAIVPGNPEASLLIEAVSREDQDTQMPPKDQAALSQEEVDHLRKWIKEGAYWPESERTAPEPLTNEEISASHWAYQPITNPSPPEITSPEWKNWAQNPIDLFIAERLISTGIQPGQPASSRDFLRRASYDLTGLPPSPEHLTSYLKNDDQRELIDELLDSPEYGRKWGRHWLDVARYSDTAGDNSDFPIPQMSLYRDYVIQSFNEGLPFNEFIKEQLAGDLMPARDQADLHRRRIIATSFISSSMRFCDDLRNDMPLVIGDTIDAVGQAFLGMQLSCAKCHNHKYDPISTADYYGIYGFFASTRYPFAGREGRQFPVNLVSTSTDPAVVQEVETINREVYDKALNGGRFNNLTKGKGLKVLTSLRKQEQLSELAFGVRDQAQTRDAHVHKRGNPKKPGRLVPRSFLSAITPREKPQIPEGKSGRLQLAEWIASPKNPLTARVMVNRIWGWHFGTALVKTPNNFGMSGEGPSHPELLDYLAQRFIESGWSIKAINRLIMNSATYQQEWRENSKGPRIDTSNRLQWRFDRRRLTAEELRDSALLIAGRLNFKNPGPHPFPGLGKMNYTQHRPFENTFQHDSRSIFLMTSRIRKQAFLTLFDGADPTQSTGQRHTSTVPLQALYLLNNPRIHEFAISMADRIRLHHIDDSERIDHAFLLAYLRLPSDSEKQTLLNKLSLLRKEDQKGQSPWQVICQALLLSNEFAYLD